ncbi:MAG TPA: PP2C family protein-serine/threonine phosphatase [Bacteroidota bacterium]|nr:PP2C family protein-serine/threonine phosphatase [Bacteroidota bacterium]
MKFRNLVLLAGAGALFIIIFVVNAVLKVDVEFQSLIYLREGAVALALLLCYIYVHYQRQLSQKKLIQKIGMINIWAGGFLAVFTMVSFFPLGGFETRDMRIIPRDYITVFFTSVLSIAAGIMAIVTQLLIKEFLLYRRKRGTKRNFYILLAVMILASVSAADGKPLESSVTSQILFTLAILLIIVNSFRLAWIAYLPRREKIYTLLYSLLAFFIFIAIDVFVSMENRLLSLGLLYFSHPLHVFVQLNSIFVTVYFGMVFISTLFQLPTAEAFDRKQTEISSLHNLMRLINQVFDFNDLADTVTKMTMEVCEAGGAWLEILPTQNSTQKSGIVSNKNILEDDIRTILDGGDKSLRQLVLSTKKALMIDDLSNDRRTRHLPMLKKVGSILIVPLIMHETVIGILYATKEIDFGFDQDDADALTGFADQVAIAIENARLIERSLEKERLQRELMLAQEMQKRLLPQTLPQHTAFGMHAVSSPALEVGGDYYDVAELGEGRYGIVVGDVSGKGVGAAFYMAEAKGVFQSLSKIYLSPREFLIHANKALSESMDKRSFISLLYAQIDVCTSTLTVARAGHCPMIYVAAHETHIIQPSGIGLGLTSGAVFATTIEEKTLTMQSGDILVMYTDGVTESRNALGEEFGPERLRRLIEAKRLCTVEEITEEILQNVWEFTDATGYDDDLTVFVVKWNGIDDHETDHFIPAL